MIFFSSIDTPLGFFAFFFALLVVFVNGWTDAPNSIFSVVNSKALKLWQGALLSGVFNFLGVFITSFLGASVAKAIFSFVNFSSARESHLIALSCFVTIVIFGIVAWLFGLPSSESHALIFSLAGALFASGIKNDGFFNQIALIVFYLVFSCIASFLASFLIARVLPKGNYAYKKLLILSSSLLSFMHGAQDGQKFLAILIFVLGLSSSTGDSFAPISLILLVSIVMSLSTMLGGGRIIKSLSKTSSLTDYHSSFCSDLGSFFTLLLCSFLGMPISTGNVKSLSIVGTSLAKKEQINKKMTGKILLTSVITLPICFFMGYFICKLLSFIL